MWHRQLRRLHVTRVLCRLCRPSLAFLVWLPCFPGGFDLARGRLVSRHDMVSTAIMVLGSFLLVWRQAFDVNCGQQDCLSATPYRHECLVGASWVPTELPFCYWNVLTRHPPGLPSAYAAPSSSFSSHRVGRIRVRPGPVICQDVDVDDTVYAHPSCG